MSEAPVEAAVPPGRLRVHYLCFNAPTPEAECGRRHPLRSTREVQEVTCDRCKPGIAHLLPGYSFVYQPVRT